MKLFRWDVLRLAVPVLTEQVFVMLMGVINTMMVSNIGKEAVSAVGMVDSVNNIFIAFFSSLAVGSTVVIAHYIGQRHNEEANESAKQALFSGILFSILITLLIYVFKSQLIFLLFGSAEQTVIENTRIYLAITLPTYPLIALTSISCGVLRGAGDTKTPMKVTIIMNMINIIMSYLLIYGLEVRSGQIHFGFAGFGVKGAALGIAAARLAGTILILMTLIKGSKLLKLKNILSFKLNIGIQRSIFGIGIPASVESMLFNGGKLITQVYIVGMGTASIAANSIASSVAGMVNIPGNALAIAAITLVGQHMGRGEDREAESSLWYLTKLSIVSQLLICALAFPLAGSLTSLYTQNSEVSLLTVSLIRSMALCAPLLWSLSFVLPSGLRGAGDVKYTMIISVASMWVFRITLGYIFGIPLKLGVLGVWMGMYVDWAVRGVLYFIRLKSGKWRKNTVIKEEPDATGAKF